MPEHGDGKMNIIIDYQGWTLRNAPPLRTTKETISILQNQDPERLYKAYLYNPPGIFSVFFGMARPFLDPVTAAKINFIYSSNDKSLEIEFTDTGFEDGATWTATIGTTADSNSAVDDATVKVSRSWSW